MRISSHYGRVETSQATSEEFQQPPEGGDNKLPCSSLELLHSLGCCCPFCWLSCVKSVSLLSSQMGTFRSHDGDYFIEPLLSVDEQEDEEEQNKPHVIYRRSTPQREPSTGKHACDTSGICFLVKYRYSVDMGSLPHCKEAAAFSAVCKTPPCTIWLSHSPVR